MGTVTEYLDGVDAAVRPALRHVVDRARAVVPGLDEGVSYAMPAWMLQGKGLLAVSQARTHLGLYPFSGQVVAAVASRLDGFSISSGTIRFSADHPVPEDVLDDVSRLRQQEIARGRGRQPDLWVVGGAKGTRTPNPLLAKQVRCQLRHSPVVLGRFYGGPEHPATRGSPRPIDNVRRFPA